jgi:hypothetical protein
MPIVDGTPRRNTVDEDQECVIGSAELHSIPSRARKFQKGADVVVIRGLECGDVALPQFTDIA